LVDGQNHAAAAALGALDDRLAGEWIHGSGTDSSDSAGFSPQ